MEPHLATTAPATAALADTAHAATASATTALAPWAILATLLVLAAATAVEPRLVPRGQWLVVLRSGRAIRVIESGITVRLPLLERYARLPRGRIRRPFVVAGRTIEGVEVRLSGEVDIRIVDPAEAAEASLVPADLALDEAERALARLVARRDVVSLADLPIDVELAIDVPGLRITEVDIAKVEIELTPRTVHSVVSQAK